MTTTLAERTSAALRRRLECLAEEFSDPDVQFTKRRELTEPLYSYAPDAPAQREDFPEPFDLRAHTESWDDMVRLQRDGMYPAAFAQITSPVLMLHGAYDPHPGPLIRASLQAYLSQLEYCELDRCGHYPWTERFAGDEFFALMREWITARLASPSR